MSRRRKCRGDANTDETQSNHHRSLPIPAEIHARLVLSDKPDDGAVLRAIAHLAMVVAPSRLGGIARKVNPRNMMMMTDLGAAQAAEQVLRAIRASAVFA